MLYLSELSFVDLSINTLRSTVSLALIVGYPAMVLLGLPSHMVLLGLNWRSLLAYTLSGAGLGLLLTLAFAVSIHPDFGENVGYVTLVSAATASIFWLMRRPDRDAANPATSTP